MDIEKKVLYDCTLSAPEMNMLNKKIISALDTAPVSSEVGDLVLFIDQLVNKAFRIGVARGRSDIIETG